MDLKLSTEGYWRTRDGQKVRIYATDGAPLDGEEYAIHGAIEGKTGWTSELWTTDGKFFTKGEYGRDIVGRWPEEREVEAWVWLWTCGDMTFHDHPPGEGYRSDHVVGAARLTGKVVEGVFE